MKNPPTISGDLATFNKSKCEVMKMGNSVFHSRVKEEPLRRTITTSVTDFLVLTVIKTSA